MTIRGTARHLLGRSTVRTPHALHDSRSGQLSAGLHGLYAAGDYTHGGVFTKTPVCVPTPVAKINNEGTNPMTKPISATENGLKPHYKVRVVISGAILHLASWSKPKPDQYAEQIWRADWIDDPLYGDTIGNIDWYSVKAITWRWSE
jgi:hypothetical protein